MKRIVIDLEDDIAIYCIATTEQARTVTEDLIQFDNEQMQQLVICHRLLSSEISLNLEIVDPTKEDGETAEQHYGGFGSQKEDGEIVEQSYRCSNLHKVDRHSTSPEEVEVPERHHDPQSYVAAMYEYLIYWLWSKHEGWNLKSNLKSECDLMLGI